MFFEQIKDPRLAQYAYIVGSPERGEALIIDPQRDVDRYVELAESQGMKITAAAETHIHADFLSGARELAERHGARLFLSGEGGEEWQPEWALAGGYDLELLVDGGTFVVGDVEVTALHTPGHTPEHMTFLLRDLAGGEDSATKAVTGDFVFVGDLGRPDLLESAAGIEGVMESSARSLYGSVQRAMAWPEDLELWPGHGAGSACGKALGEAPTTTWGTEKRFSPAIRAADEGEQAFVDFILDGQPEPPLYFARMKQLNRDGVPLIGEVIRPPELTAQDLRELDDRTDVVVIDTRADREAYLAAHVPGSVYAPLDDVFHTVVGSYFDPASPICVIVSEHAVEHVVRDLVRIGLDHVLGWFRPSVFPAYQALGGPLTSTRSVDFQGMQSVAAGSVLDVRSSQEFSTGGHVTAAINIPHTRLWNHLDELQVDRTVLVYCESGRRAVRAASFLERHGYDVVVVDDDLDEWKAGGSVTSAVA